MSSRIRAVLIDDSAFMRKIISDIIRTDESIELVGIANDGKQGSEMAFQLKPDVVIQTLQKAMIRETTNTATTIVKLPNI